MVAIAIMIVVTWPPCLHQWHTGELGAAYPWWIALLGRVPRPGGQHQEDGGQHHKVMVKSITFAILTGIIREIMTMLLIWKCSVFLK